MSQEAGKNPVLAFMQKAMSVVPYQRVFNLIPYNVRVWLYRTPAVRLLRRLLERVLPAGIHEVEIKAGTIKGYRMALDLRHQKTYWLGIGEMKIQQTASQVIRPGSVVYDIGAHVGFFSLIFSELTGPRGRVYAFEPYPPNAALLRRQIELNALKNIEVVEKAVAERAGEICLYPGRSDQANQLTVVNRENQCEPLMTLQAVSLDEFVYRQERHPPDVIKIDVEGGEGLVMRGMSEVLGKQGPTLIIEIHGSKCLREVEETLRAHNYQWSLIDVSDEEPGHDLYAHILAVRKDKITKELAGLLNPQPA